MYALTQIGRIVAGHQWSDLAEWVEALDALADLSDGEIESLAARGLVTSGRFGDPSH